MPLYTEYVIDVLFKTAHGQHSGPEKSFPLVDFALEMPVTWTLSQLGNKSQMALKKKGIECQLVLSLCGSLNLYVKGHTSLVWGEKHAIESIFLKKPS